MNGNDGEALPVQYEGGYSEVAHHGGGYRYPMMAGDSESADFRRLMSALRDKVWWILAAMVVGGVLGFFYSRTQAPSFRSSASVWFEAGQRNQGPVRANDVLSGSGWAEVLLSNAVLEPVVRRFRMHIAQVSPDPNEVDVAILDHIEVGDDLRPGTYAIRVVDGNRYQLLAVRGEEEMLVEEGTLGAGVGSTIGIAWNPSAGELSDIGEDLVFGLTRPQARARGLATRFSVRYDDRADIIHSELSWPNAARGAQIHNALIESYMETTRRLTNGRLREQVEILEQQSESTSARLAAAEFALENFRVDAITKPGERTPVVVPGAGSADLADPVFGQFFQQQYDLDQIEADLAELDAILSEGNGQLNVLRLRLVPAVTSSPPIGATIAQLDQLEVDMRTLLYTYTPEAPQVVAISSQIEDIHRVQLPALIRELQLDLRNREATLSSQIGARAEELREIPVRTIEQARLDRQKQLAEQLDTNVRTRLEAARLAERTALTSVQPLDWAFEASRPEAQTLPAFFVLLGSLIGLGVSAGSVLVRDRLDQRIRHPDDISDKFGLPLLGVVPQLKAPDRNRAAAAVAVESFRSIRTQLSHANGGNGADGGSGGQILITSSTPREGKSVVAANLAISYASSGLRTLLIDADVRRGRLHAVFGFPRSPGLTEHLAGKASLEDITRRHDTPDLDIICSGALSSDAELIGGDVLDDFLTKARESYDVVVTDGPPLAAGADALILGQRSDKVVMVFRAGTTSEGMARSRLGMLGNVDLPIVGAILNAVPEHAPYYDQYVNYYYYAEAEAS
ncbi:MAG: polysaccharide biosynthesis tyrosine autokinase [Gemmatimonadetes bacterium]|nr:polysaccharide biosynthesis tyrosine autokinase [Gemmatimonadota bacterium]